MAHEIAMAQVIFKVTAYQEGDKWQGVVLNSDEEPIIYGSKRNQELAAIQSAKRELYRALGCSHEMVYEEHSWIGQDRMGNDLYGHHGKCKKCGYVDSFESED